VNSRNTPFDEKLPILIAEDNAVNLKLATILVRKIGYPFETVLTGREAVEAVQKNRFAMVLMDIQMPDMDGYEATSAIRSLPGEAGDTPIVAMTAHVMTGERERCLEVGMDDYLSKPVHRQQLAEIIRKWAQGRAAAVREAAPAYAEKTNTLDVQVLTRLRAMQDDGEPDIVTELINMFVDIMPEQLELLQEAVDRRDQDSVARIAHYIHGSCRNLGAKHLSRLCSYLERPERMGTPRDQSDIFQELREEYLRVKRALESQRIGS
jgi:CheY-like chemotaxis protein